MVGRRLEGGKRGEKGWDRNVCVVDEDLVDLNTRFRTGFWQEKQTAKFRFMLWKGCFQHEKGDKVGRRIERLDVRL